MVAGIKSYLAASGVDVACETESGNLVLSPDRNHLADNGGFDIQRMVETLEHALQQALADGYEGLWATGDMTWEFGPEKDLSRLLEYEWRLEEFMREHPQMGGICQYHVDTLPRDVLHQGLLTHSHLFVNQTLTLINPLYLPAESFTPAAIADARLDHALGCLLNEELVS
jgi:hypothetical protein